MPNRDAMPYPTSPSPWLPPPRFGGSGGGRLRNGLRRKLAVAGGLFTLAFLLNLLGTIYGLFAVVLAVAVLGFLGRHRDDGGRRQQVKALTEYATVGALVFALLAAANAVPTPPTTKAPPRRRPPAATEQADPWGELGAQVAKLRDRLPKKLPRVEVTTTKEGR